jgi:hypothetical protein
VHVERGALIRPRSDGTSHGGNDMGTQGPVVHVERTTQGSLVSPGGGAAPPQRP